MIKLLGALLTALTLASPTQGVASEAKPDQGTLGAAAPFIALSVADLDQQLAWYTETLGFRVHSRGEVPNRGIKFALLQSGSALIELLQIPDARPRQAIAPSIQDSSRIHGFFKSGMVVPDIEATYNSLKAKGVKFAFELSKPAGGPYRVFGLNDPEGNLLQIFGV